MTTRILARAALVASVALATPLAAQVQTEVPPRQVETGVDGAGHLA